MKEFDIGEDVWCVYTENLDVIVFQGKVEGIVTVLRQTKGNVPEQDGVMFKEYYVSKDGCDGILVNEDLTFKTQQEVLAYADAYQDELERYM